MAGNILGHGTDGLDGGVGDDYQIYRIMAEQVADGLQESFRIPMGATPDGSGDMILKTIYRKEVPEFLIVWDALHADGLGRQTGSELPNA